MVINYLTQKDTLKNNNINGINYHGTRINVVDDDVTEIKGYDGN